MIHSIRNCIAKPYYVFIALGLSACLLASYLLVSSHALAQAPVSKETKSAAKYPPLNIVVGKSRLFKFRSPVTKVSVGDPAIADVMIVNPQELYILGKKAGTTNVMAWHANDEMTVLDLTIGVDTTSVQALLAKLLPTEKGIRVSAAGESLILSGTVSDAFKVQQAVQIAEEFSSKKVMNMLTTQHLPQVLIEVKIAEVKKEVLDTLGVNVSGTDFAFAAIGGAALGATAPVAGMSPNAAGRFGSTKMGRAGRIIWRVKNAIIICVLG